MITNTWNIVTVKRQKSDDLITEVQWKLTGTDGDFSHTMMGAVFLQRGDSFIQFSELTEEVLVGWVKEALGEEQITSLENNVDYFVNKQKEETTTVDGLPWQDK